MEAWDADIKNQPLSWSAEKIHNVIYNATDEEHIQILTDWVEMIQPNVYFSIIYCKREVASTNG